MTKRIHVFATTDLHGEMAGFEQSDKVRSLKKENPNAIWIDNGDYFCGNALTTYYNTQLDYSPLAELANRFGYDVMVPGNHDLDYGVSFLQKQVKHLKMPYVCANLFTLDKEYLFEPFTLVEREGVTVAIIGLMTQALPQISPYNVTKDFICVNTQEALEKVFPLLPKDVDLKILAYHGGLEADPSTGRPVQYSTGEDQAYQLSKENPQLDGLIAGHQHFSYSGDLNQMAFIQPGSHGRQVGELSFCKNNTTWTHSAQLYSVEKKELFSSELLKKFETWMEEQVDKKSVETFLLEYFSIPNENLLFTFNGTTRKDLLESFPVPYTFGRYTLSKEEWEKFSTEEEISSQTKGVERNLEMYSNDRRLPPYRLQENYIDNLFDAYHRWMMK